MSSRWYVVRAVSFVGCVLVALSACAVLGKRPPQPTPTREPSPALLNTSIHVRSGQWSGEPQCATELPDSAAAFASLVRASIAGKLRRANAASESDPDAITVLLSGTTKCGNCVPQQAGCSTQPLNFEHVHFVLQDRAGGLVDAQELELEGTVASQQADQIASLVLSSPRLDAFAREASARRAQAEAARSASSARASHAADSGAPAPPAAPPLPPTESSEDH